MPTRFLENRVLQRAFDLLAPADHFPKQYLRWRELARLTGLGENWVRKRHQDRDRAELDVRSIEAVRRALESHRDAAASDEVKTLVELLAAVQRQGASQRGAIRAPSHVGGRLRLRVVNVGFIRSNSANYCQRLEAGVRLGMLDGLQHTHLVNDESIDLSRARSHAARAALILELTHRFCVDPSYVDRTYLVPLGTVAAEAVARTLQSETLLRERLGKDLRVVFAGVTDPESTGILDLDPDAVGGVYAGPTMAERLGFIEQAFPNQSVAFLYDPQMPQDVIATERVQECARPNFHLVKAAKTKPTRLPAAWRSGLVTGYTFINWRIHELVRDNPDAAFIGVNLYDLGRGAILSTGNDDLLFGMECARRLMAPDCRNEINLRDVSVLRPTPVFGVNQKACNQHGLSPRIAARNRCQVVIE